MAAVSGVAEFDTAIKFFGSQVGGTIVTPVVYTGSPMKLLYHDVKLSVMLLFEWFCLVLPWKPYGSGHLDELYPSLANLRDMFLHLVLVICQSLFLLSIPVWFFFPVWTVMLFVGIFIVSNKIFCLLLNGFKLSYDSNPEITKDMPQLENEQWVFVNGVAVGRHWLQSNIDRLAITFGRPVRGVHNKTSGIIFDVIECLIQRNLDYATEDIRNCYQTIKSMLYESSKTKIVFILHSQGAIEGGMILDWLLQEVPQDLLAKLEVYTFGNAANHFNNPHLHLNAQMVDKAAAVSKSRIPAILTATSRRIADDLLPVTKMSDKTIRHIEHYANSKDPVSRLGVLQYTRVGTNISSASAPLFMGRVFVRPARGHQFNQHYLDNMFPLNRDATRALDVSEFMEGEVEIDDTQTNNGKGKNIFDKGNKNIREGLEQSYQGADPIGGEDETVEVEAQVWDSGSLVSPVVAQKTESWPVIPDENARRRSKVADLSRLWHYRNGGSPLDDT